MRVPRRALLLASVLPGPSRAQPEWPRARPIRVIVPYSSGSAPDGVFRTYAGGLTARLGQVLVPDNLPGQAGMAGTAVAAHAAPDGYTLLVSINAPISVSRHLQARMNYDADRDLRPVAMLAMAPLVLAVRPGFGRSFQDFLDRMRATGERQAYASTGIGSAAHLLTEAIKAQTGLELDHRIYRGTPEALTDMLNGRVAAMLVLPGQVQSYFRSGALVPLLQTGDRRMAILPGVPTATETGLDRVVGSGWIGLFVPRATPDPVVATLAAAARDTAAEPGIAGFLSAQGYAAGGMSPAQVADFVARESDDWGAIIRRLGLAPPN